MRVARVTGDAGSPPERRSGGPREATRGSGLGEVDARRRDVEDLGGHAGAELGGVPGLVAAGDDDPLRPALHPDDLVVEAADDLAVDVAGLVGGEPGHDGRGVLRVHAVELALGDVVGLEGLAGTGHGGGDAGEPGRADAVGGDVRGGELLGERQREPGDGGLGGGVVGLAEVAAQAGTRGGVDDAAVDAGAGLVLLTEVLGGEVRHRPRAPHVDVHHDVPVLDRHVPDGGVAHDAGVVHDDVELAVGVDGLLHHLAALLVVRDVAVVRGGDAALGLDEVDGLVGGATGALAGDAATEVVDDDLGAVLGQLHGVAPADAVAGSGDDGDLAVEHAHAWCPLLGVVPQVRQERS